jgi:hypothetical protein
MNTKSPTLFECKICHHTQADFLIAQELMFKTRDSFEYAQCKNCDCLQLIDIPSDFAKYYPSDYYSFSSKNKNSLFKKFRRGFKKKLVLTHSTHLSFIFKFLFHRYSLFWTYREIGIGLNSKILDVGAGSGAHVKELRSAGVKGAIGVDPFLENDLFENDELIVKKSTLEGLSDKYDLITFHHSFEHIPNQLETLVHARNLLTENCAILIRIPTVSSEAYKIYRELWFQLDAPRHLFLHSHESIKHIAHQADLNLVNLFCDSSENQFIISENYRLMTSSDANNPQKPIQIPIQFSKEKIKEFKDRTKELNRSLLGDQICVILKSN